jgi:hypothetical protein
MHRLGLTDDELCTVLAVDPLSVIAAKLDHRPELAILLDLTAEAEDAVGGALLRRWLRTTGPTGRPVDHLLARDFEAFEHDLAGLERRGYVIRGGGA